MRLNAKLVIMMLSLLVIAVLTLFILNQHSQNDLVQEIQDSSTAVSEVLQKSVEDLTSPTEVETSRLPEYLKEARRKGINEINIIDPEGEIIDSSDPAKIGNRRDIRKLEKEKGFKALPGAVAGRSVAGTPVKPYQVVVPVIIGDEQWGYVEINLLLDNIREIQHDNFVRRLLATCIIFAFGILLTFFLARRYTEPINRLAAGVKKVSAGDLSVRFPETAADEIGELAGTFNEMVAQLREREHLERRLREAEHLSKVGQLASGIAHEIRNPLNYISLAIDHLKGEMLPVCGAKQEELVLLADKIKEEVRRANYMVLTFMNYGRPLKLRPARISYPELLDRALPLLEEKLKEQRIELVREIPADLPLLQADPELLRTVVFNFVTNGAQAMPGGGRIILGAAFDAERNLFQLTFTDAGTGITPENLAKIFQPYFTTKEAGIGLGLAITERIVREHGGEIRVESTVGHGTSFVVQLPATVRTSEPDSPSAEEIAA